MTTIELIGAIVGLAGIAIQGGSFAYLLGKHSQRIATMERDTDELKRKTEEHSAAIAVFAGMKDLLKEVRDDVKGLLSNGRPTRRGTGNA